MSALRFGHPATVPAQAKHSATVIFLHGLGDSGSNLSALSQNFRLPHVKWIFPTAPNRPITLNGGMSMPGWFDLYQLDKLMQGEVDHEGIKTSTDYLSKLVKQEMEAGLPSSRIVVGGFSQGGHVAAKYALTTPTPPPGCIMLSTWLEPFPSSVSPANQTVKFWIAHGSADSLIPAPMASVAENTLKQKGCRNVLRKTYQGLQHSTCAQELDDVRAFLLELIPEEAGPPLSPEEIERMSVKDLRLYLRSKGVPTASFLEKSEFVAAAKQTLGAVPVFAQSSKVASLHQLGERYRCRPLQQ